MNEKMKQYLETVINSAIKEDTESGDKAFHQYIRMKTQNILLGEGDMDNEEIEPKKSKMDMSGEDDVDKGMDEECPECHHEPCTCDGEGDMEEEEKSKKKPTKKK